MNKSRAPRVCVLGIWHLGSVVSACLAELGREVIGVEPNEERVTRLRQGQPPVYEPGLEELFKKHLASGRLRFTPDLQEGVRSADCVFIAFDTPVDSKDQLDLTPIREAVHQITPLIQAETLILVQSQVPVGTCDEFKESIKKIRKDWKGELAYMPENLRLGQAVSRFMNPAMVIIGAEEAATWEAVDKIITEISSPRVRTNLKTAEMAKHALNAFFSTCISFANELGNLCDEAGADGLKVAEALRLDERIGPKALVEPGAPFGGGTLARDLRALQGLGKTTGCETRLIDAVYAVNEQQKDLVLRRLRGFFGDLNGLEVGVLGLTYKAGTSTLRRSQTIDMIQRLIRSGVSVRAYDPQADLTELDPLIPLRIVAKAEEVADGADVLVIATEWSEFRELDFESLKMRMKTPVVLDIKNILDPEKMHRLGIHYFGLGRGIKPKERKKESDANRYCRSGSSSQA